MNIQFLIGIIVGVVLEAIVSMVFKFFKSTFGVLKIDNSNPEKDVYRVVINDLDSLNKKKYVELKVEHETDFSQK